MADEGTRLETDEDVRRVLQMHRQPAAGRLPVQAATAAADDCPPLFRPKLRPPTPVLIVCDDGSESGESVRIRKDRFVIGRTEGDVTIPNDSQISSRHAECGNRSSGKSSAGAWSIWAALTGPTCGWAPRSCARAGVYRRIEQAAIREPTNGAYRAASNQRQ